ncbi:MAG: HEAT repeat domain-containing protein, partial [Planctomycetota bacterium]
PETLNGAADLAASQGFGAASDALRSALRSQDWDVAIEAIQLLVDTYGNENLAGNSLGDALVAPERRVRYHAAIAALHMSPKSGLPNADKVSAIAAQAASEEALRQVLVIDDREDTRSRLVMDLAHAGFVSGGEANGAIGVSRAKSSPMMDVIIVRADLGDHATVLPSRRHASSLMVIDELLADARTRDMRIVVLLQDTPEAQTAAVRDFFSGKYGDSINGFINVPIDTASAVETVTAAAAAGDLNPDRQRANELAARAANAFAETDFSCKSFNLEVAVDPLSEAALNGPTPDVRINAVRALGNIRVGGIGTLVQVLSEGEGDDLRAAAAAALGGVLSVMDGTPEQVDALIEAARGEGAVADAALQALGKVRTLTAEQRLQIFQDHRLNVAERAGG